MSAKPGPPCPHTFEKQTEHIHGKCPFCQERFGHHVLVCTKCRVNVHKPCKQRFLDDEKQKRAAAAAVSLAPALHAEAPAATTAYTPHALAASTPPAHSPTASDPSMPPSDEVERQFALICPNLNIKKATADAMPLDKKWQLVQMQRRLASSEGDSMRAKLKNVSHAVNMLKAELSSELLEQLLVILRTQPIDWLQSFLDMNGMVPIVTKLKSLLLSISEKSPEQVRIEGDCVRAVKAVMNNGVGMRTVAKMKDAVKVITLCLGSKTLEEKLKGDVLSVLTVLCMTTDDAGITNYHAAVLSAMNSFKQQMREKRRFQSLLTGLKATTSLDLKAKYLALINALINEAPDIDLRVSIRNEFLSLGIGDILKEFVDKPDHASCVPLMTQIDVFRELGELDTEELEHRFESIATELKVDVASLDGVISALREMAKRAGLEPVLLSVLQNTLAVLVAKTKPIEKLLLSDRLLRQISLHGVQHADDEAAAASSAQQAYMIGTEENRVDFERILATVDDKANEVRLRRDLDLAAEQKSIAQKKVTAQALQIEEKDKLLAEKTKELEELRAKIADFELQFRDGRAQAVGAAKREEAERAAKALQEQRDSHDAEGSGGAPPPPPPPPPPPGMGAPPPPPPPPGMGGPPPPPPPPPGMGGPPPPPPPPGMGGPPPPPGMPGFGRPAAPQVNPAVTKLKKPSGGKLKGLQWTRVPPMILKDTVFARFDASALDSILSEMPYETLEADFSAKRTEESTATSASQEKKKAQIIDSKTAQTVSILLKGMKGLTISEIITALQRLDERCFEVGTVNGLLKCLPSKDDVHAIQDFLSRDDGSMSMLGLPEVFALEMSHVGLPEEKLKAFAVKLTFPNKLSDLKADVKTLELACTQVMSSKMFERILQYVLMFGNFLNSGTPRAGFPAFKIGTLSKLRDVKTSDNKRTMIHVLVSFIESKHPNLLKWSTELDLVLDASKVAGSTLEADINSLGKGLKDIEAAIAAVTAADVMDKQPFLDIISAFLARAKEDHASLREQHKAMAEKYTELCKFFGEDTSKPLTPEELFSELVQFIESWKNAVAENEKAREQAAREQRLAAAKQQRFKAQAEQDKKKAAASLGMAAAAVANAKDVDDIMGDVLSGQAFPSRRSRKPRT